MRLIMSQIQKDIVLTAKEPRLNILRNFDLTRYNSMRLQVKADYFAAPCSIVEIKAAIDYAESTGLQWFILGGGTNIIFTTSFIKAFIIKLGRTFNFINYSAGANTLEIGASTPLPRLVGFALRNQLQGLVNFWGIPGTVGGAIRGNAGAMQSSICEYVQEITALEPTGELNQLDISKLKWGYRYCDLGDRTVISAKLKSKQTAPEEVWSSLQRVKIIRANQPSLASAYSAGCIFKNPPRKSAGALIDAAGLKGIRIGDAEVSEKHANFIINRHQARPEDVVNLIKLVQQRVFEHSGVWLEPEVRLIGNNL